MSKVADSSNDSVNPVTSKSVARRRSSIMIHDIIDSRLPSEENKEELPPTPVLGSVRFNLALVCFFGFAVLYAQRVNLSIAMVCMVVHNFTSTENKSSSNKDDCGDVSQKAVTDADFNWSKELQGHILASFFYGYLLLELPGGILAEKLGAKHVVTFSMLPVALLTLLIPVAARASPYLLIVMRVLVGVGESMLYPAAIALWGCWSPPKERSMLVGLSLSGGQFGNALILPIGGLLCSNVGWDSVFYFSGGVGLLFCLIWIVWVSDHPEKHKSMSKKELDYLQSVVQPESEIPPGIPWCSIFLSAPVWAIIIAHTTGNYAYYMNLTQIPTYMKEVLKFDIKQNGGFSMLPYLMFWIVTMIAGVLSDYFIASGYRIVIIRKTFACIGLVFPALFLVATSFIKCTEPWLAILFLCLAVGSTGFGFSSYLVNHGDLAPHYAGTLFGISNTFATLPGFVAPTIVGAVTENGTQEEWQIAFYIAAGVNTFGALMYLLLGSAELQPWSAVHQHDMPAPKRLTVVSLANVHRRMSVILSKH